MRVQVSGDVERSRWPSGVICHSGRVALTAYLPIVGFSSAGWGFAAGVDALWASFSTKAFCGGTTTNADLGTPPAKPLSDELATGGEASNIGADEEASDALRSILLAITVWEAACA